MQTLADFYAAIRAHPDDDALRLAFADWLEERGEHGRADFVRLQLRLEPVRDDYDDPLQDLLLRRERESEPVLKEWLGPLGGLRGEPSGGTFEVVFRRGLPDEVRAPVGVFVGHADEIARRCPTVRKLVLYDVCGRGAELAGCAALTLVPHLYIADWVTAADAEALAGCPHLGNVETLTFWIGQADQREVCRVIGDAANMPRLEQVVLVQMFGGVAAGDAGAQAELDVAAEELADFLGRRRPQGRRGAAVASVHRPFAGRFPLAADIRRGVYPGKLPDGRQVMALPDSGRGRPEVLLLHFDAAGHMTGSVYHPFPGLFREEGGRVFYAEEPAILRRLRHDLGFEPAGMQVREFLHAAEEEFVAVYKFGPFQDFILNPGPGDDVATGAPRREVNATLYAGWLERGHFVLDYGNDYWIGPDGRVWSS